MQGVTYDADAAATLLCNAAGILIINTLPTLVKTIQFTTKPQPSTIIADSCAQYTAAVILFLSGSPKPSLGDFSLLLENKYTSFTAIVSHFRVKSMLPSKEAQAKWARSPAPAGGGGGGGVGGGSG